MEEAAPERWPKAIDGKKAQVQGLMRVWAKRL
jgi:hypothetical protein